ncbi:unnamed protein product [Arabidopsis halleri]
MLAVFEKSVAGVKLFGMTFPAGEPGTGSENLPTHDSVDAIKEIAKLLGSLIGPSWASY